MKFVALIILNIVILKVNVYAIGNQITEYIPIKMTNVITFIPVKKSNVTIYNRLNTNDWNWFFPKRKSAIYSLQHFIDAIHIYNTYATSNGKSHFLEEGTLQQQAEELAAFFSNVSRETSGTWETAPITQGGWIEYDPNISMYVWKGGLYWLEEMNYSTNFDGTTTLPIASMSRYVNSSSKYQAVSNRSYHGRGPIQLSWNDNYGYFSEWLYSNGLYSSVITTTNTLLINPGLVNNDATIAFLSAIWFWMTAQAPKPSAHDVMMGKAENNLPNRNDGKTIPKTANGDINRNIVAYRFGTTINIINGGLECNKKSHKGPPQRVSYYEAYAKYLNYRFNAGATVLGVGYIANNQITKSSSEIEKISTCYALIPY